MSDETLLEGAGWRLLEHMEQDPAWEGLDELVRDRLREAAFDLGKLTLLELAGRDVSAELAHVRAQLASWEFQQASQARRVLGAALLGVGELVGALLRGFVQ